MTNMQNNTPTKINKINKKILRVFGKQRMAVGPMLYDRLAHRPVVLFIGLNPSLANEDIYSLQNVQKHQDFFKKLQRAAKHSYPYFRPLHRFAKSAKLTLWDPDLHAGPKDKNSYWEHIDLFFERGTASTKLLTLSNAGFEAAQLRLTCELIQLMRPRNIVILGRDAARHFCGKAPCASLPGKEPHTSLTFREFECRVFCEPSWSGGYIKADVLSKRQAKLKGCLAPR